ncbi:MAG TPA: NrfD/PsrC family molybdoenzyme membrane anchor subunit [Terriglobales bacterium]|nr:NrfD/PsrC family molybdoenzyme membrane anchor subunit [Terriglobales bacterium]
MSHDPVPFSNAKASDFEREHRLTEIRREAETRGQVKLKGVRPIGAPFPRASAETGYYGIPLLKPPQWTNEIPLYFFVGGAAGAAAVIGAMAHYTGADRKLVRDARYLAAAGAIISPALLVADLGRPERFLGMLRVFKPQSPMSVGSWTLVGFGGAATAAAFAGILRERYGPSFPVSVLEKVGNAASIPFGLGLASYTGVLIGATAIPVWNQNISDLPMHFAASGLNAAVGLLELFGNEKSRALQALGLGAAIFEIWEGVRIEGRTQSHLDPLKHGKSGAITRVGGVLSGPVPTALRIASAFASRTRGTSLRRWAALSSVAGSLLTRFAWIQAGRASAQDWRQPLEIPPDAQSWPDKHPKSASRSKALP